MNQKTVVRVTLVIAVLLLITVIVLFFLYKKEPEPQEGMGIPSSDEILFGLNYKTSIDCNLDKVEDYILSDIRFADYTLKEEYSTIYQIGSESQEEELKAVFDISEELPVVDYKKNKLLLSVGREIERLSDKGKVLTDDGQKVVTITYGDEFFEDKIFVYTTRSIEFLSGNELETYYFEKVSPLSNLIEGERETSSVISEGKYHRIYLKRGGIYEYILFSENLSNPSTRCLSKEKPEITEYTETAVKVLSEGVTFFYNPKLDIKSETTLNNLFFVANDIVAFARVYNGEVIMVIRNLYDSSKYGYSYRMPFNQDTSNVYNVLQSVKVVDETHLELEYYSGNDMKLVTESFVVYNLYGNKDE